MLECQSVSVNFNDFVALDKVNLEISPGDFFGIIGPNGAGKSTLIKALSGVLAPSSGIVNLHKVNLSSLPRQKIATELAVVVQEENREFGFNVAQYVALGRSPHHGGLYFENNFDSEIIRESMIRTQTDHLANRKYDSFPVGRNNVLELHELWRKNPKYSFLTSRRIILIFIPR